MPKVIKSPKTLRPYIFHGLDLDWENVEEGGEVLCDCPFCDREDKFSINTGSGLFRCLICQVGTEKGGGNSCTFLNELWKQSEQSTQDYSKLAKNRGLKFEDPLIHWGIAKSIIDDVWLVPGFDIHGKLCQLYRYTKVGSRMALLPTPTFGHQIFGMNRFDHNKHSVFICEGIWDAILLWETLGTAKNGPDDKLIATGNPKSSLLSEHNVIAVPSCSVFREDWCSLFAGKDVILMFDNDHPKTHPKTGKEIAPAALSGMKRIVSMLAKAEEIPESVKYLSWKKA